MAINATSALLAEVRFGDRRRVGSSALPGFPRKPLWDPLIVFQVYMVMLVFSPSIYIVPGLGAAGTPATIFGCLILVLWVIGRISNSREGIGLTPLHWVVGIYCVTVLLSFCAGMLRPISTPEVLSALRGLITLASGVGVMLFAADSMRTRARLEAFLRFAVLVGFLLAAMGLVQFFTGANFVDLLHLPGLTKNSDLVGVYQRSGFPRISATAIHSIEFSAVVGMVLPVAAHFAINAKSHRAWRWAQLIVMVVALPLTVARSGAIALLIGIVFALVIANRRQRPLLIVAGLIAALAFRLLVPGILGTIRNLFIGAAGDLSISGRVGDYQATAVFLAQSPWVGRGFDTFIPSIYRTLDNEFLGTVVEAGLIGGAALALLFVVPIASSIRSAFRVHGRSDSAQAFSVAAGITTALILALTFDEFSFPMAFGMLSLMLGASGALWRVSRTRTLQDAPHGMFHLSVVHKSLVAVLVIGILAIGAWTVQSARPGFEAKASMVLGVPQSRKLNTYVDRIDAPGMSNIIQFVMESAQVRTKLADVSAPDYSVAVGTGSLAPQTDVRGYGDLVWVEARASSALAARQDAQQVQSELAAQLAGLQSDPGIPNDLKVTAVTVADVAVSRVPIYPSAAIVGLGVLAALSGFLLALALGAPREGAARRTHEARIGFVSR